MSIQKKCVILQCLDMGIQTLCLSLNHQFQSLKKNKFSLKLMPLALTDQILCKEKDYILPQNASPILGLEVAGTIINLGENTVNWNIGDEVCTLVNGGGNVKNNNCR